MRDDGPWEGSLFTADFLEEAITELDEYKALDEAALDALEGALRVRFAAFPTDGAPNEHQTEDDLIWPVLERLGWREYLRQQNLSAHGRRDVPDGLLFADAETKARANALLDEWRRYGFGIALVESKRWGLPLDRRAESAGDASPQLSLGFSRARGGGRPVPETAPSTQMLRYLRRADDLTGGKLRWGILTNGAHWRLYFSGARSVSEQFFGADLARILNLSGSGAPADADARRHWLRVLALLFGREAFLPGPGESPTFHQRAIEEGRRYEERVADSLREQIFEQIFPGLANAIAAAAPAAPLSDVREAALVVLYRLLFILYAEDRGLLPVRDGGYDDYSLRKKVRDDVRRRMDRQDAFSARAPTYWSAFENLCRLVDKGDASIGLPPYNGGLFDPARAPLVERVRLGDQIMANVIDVLSFEKAPEGRRYINYRDLGVQQLGSIYERLLEYELIRDGAELAVRPRAFARKDSGSYYTPDDLVGLIIGKTVGPLVRARMEAFDARARALDQPTDDAGMEALRALDPAERILELRVCDPAMGSGHFLVNLVDWLADRVIEAVAEAEAAVQGYLSPLTERIEKIRETITRNAQEGGWRVDAAHLDDRRIVRRMVLKRCVHGVDKNPMAVELAKVALWLHTFTVGAPLGFLDHHLRCGDSLFGAWVRSALDRVKNPLFLREPLRCATAAAAPMGEVERMTDAEIAEAHASAARFAEVEEATAPLAAFLSLLHALEWLNVREKEDRAALHDFFNGSFGDPVGIAMGAAPENPRRKRGARRLAAVLERARTLMAEEGFLGWETAFPGVWSEWEKERAGGFDAVIGNPPWDRVKLQQVEWFATRRREIALAPRAADRKRMIQELERAEDPLARQFAEASARAAAAARAARASGDYPLLSAGDVNLYSLFVERAMTLAKPDGMVGLLTPSGIASDKTAARFFQGVATGGRLRALYDFENRRTRHNAPPFFPDVDSRFKFCVFIASPSPLSGDARCAFFAQDVSELEDPERCFPLGADDFARVNPNTGTAPVFRTRRDAELTTAIYKRLPVLADRSSGEEVKAWPVKYSTMFHMTNDSGLFRTRVELEEREGAWPVGGNRYRSPAGDWTPLYQGRMIYQFDHRAASVTTNPQSLKSPAVSLPTTASMKMNPDFMPSPQYWVPSAEVSFPDGHDWNIAFRDITNATNARTIISALIPRAGAGNTLPILQLENAAKGSAVLLLANLNAIPLDFIARQKIQAQHLNWYIVEQLPVVPPEAYAATRFGPKTAGEIVREAVLELTYTAHDMAPFARAMGHVDAAGEALPPFRWDEARRRRLCAKLDAVFFHLYGVTDRDDVRHVYSTFPIVEAQERKAHGTYLSCALCLGYMNALAAGAPDAEVCP